LEVLAELVDGDELVVPPTLSDVEVGGVLPDDRIDIELRAQQLYFVLVLVTAEVGLGELQEDRHVGVLGDAVAFGVDFESPLHAVGGEGL
jgi:hypothetical protein